MEKIKTFKTLRKVFFDNVFSNLVEGVFYAIVAFALGMLMRYIYPDVGIAFYYVVFIVLISTKGIKIASYSLLPGMIFILLTEDINMDNFMLMGEFFVFALLIIFMKMFITSFNIKLITYPVMTAISLIVFLVSFFYFGRTSDKEIGFILFTVLGTVVVESIFSYAMKTSRSANVLYKSVNFDYSTFYRASFVQDVVGKYIKENSINKGVYGIFKIRFVGVYGKTQEKELLEAALDNIKNSFPEEAILFNVQLDEYGFFIPWNEKIDIEKAMRGNIDMDRTKEDPFNILSIFLKNSSKTMNTSTKESVVINVGAGISIYGVQTDSLIELHKNSSFAINYLTDGKNKINIFDPKEYKRRVVDIKELNELEGLINLNEIQLKEISVFDKGSKKCATFIEATQTGDEYYVGSLLDYVASAEMLNTFNRFISIEYLKNANDDDGLIAIPYSWESMNKGFDLDMFKNRFDVLNIKPTNIMLNFHSKWIFDDKVNIKNLNAIKELGFSISVTNPTEEKKRLIEKIDPLYIFSTKESVYSLKKCNNICALRVNDEDSLINAGKNGFNIFGGEYFENDIDEKTTNNNIINAMKNIRGV